MDSCLLYAGTEDGLFTLAYTPDESLELISHGLQGNAVRGIAAHPEDPGVAYIACGLRGWGLHRTRDAGRTFESLGFEDRWVWDVAFHPGDPETLRIGTEPPALYTTRDAGETFHEAEGIHELGSRERWMFFHPPFRAGHVHGFAVHPERPERVFAGVEHGALIFTPDGGQTWNEALVGHDLHRIAIDPAAPDHVLAGAGEGLFESRDAGQTWSAVEALHGKYIHAVLFNRRHPERVYVYSFEENSPLYCSRDGGKTWSAIGNGLPPAQQADTLTAHPTDPDILFYVGDGEDGGGRLFVSHDAGDTWRPLSASLPKVWRLRSATPILEER